MKTYALILSAGSSTRFGGTIKKQFYKINDKPVLFYSLNAFNKSKQIDEIVLVTSIDDVELVKAFVKENNFNKVSQIVVGGDARQESVKHGLDVISDEGYVLIHDAARPLVDEEIISSLLKALEDNDGAAPAIKVVDTIIRVENNELSSFEDREKLYRIQTPQAFRLNVIKEAHVRFLNHNATDDTQLVKLLGKKVAIVPGKEQLRKITTLEDTNAIEAYIKNNEQLQSK